MQSLKQTEVDDLLRITQKAEELVAMVTTLQALLLQDGPNLALAVWTEKERKLFILEPCPVMGRGQQRYPFRPFDYL
jgi:hypothetical protein